MDPFFKQSTSRGDERKKEGAFKKMFKNQDDSKGQTKFTRNDKKFTSGKNDYKSSKGVYKKIDDDSKLHEIKGDKIEKGTKVFDKKLYRMKKYSNKYKLDQWENKRRKEVLKKYYKDTKNEPMAGRYQPYKFDESQGEGFDETDNKIHFVLNPEKLEEMKLKFGKNKNKTNNDGRAIKPFKRVKEEMQRLRQEKIDEKEAKLKAAKEKEEAIAKYKAKKAERFKKLSRKTKTGQPVMKDRMQMLLEAIQKSS